MYLKNGIFTAYKKVLESVTSLEPVWIRNDDNLKFIGVHSKGVEVIINDLSRYRINIIDDFLCLQLIEYSVDREYHSNWYEVSVDFKLTTTLQKELYYIFKALNDYANKKSRLNVQLIQNT